MSAAVVPTLESLQFLSGQQFRAVVGTMLERLGHELLTSETTVYMLTRKNGQKYVVACALPSHRNATSLTQVKQLHDAILTANAISGYYVTTRGFTRDAEAYAATAPITLVDTPKLLKSLEISMAGMTPPDSYQAMCRLCGDIVHHRLSCVQAISCRNGHSVAPTIAQAAIFGRKLERGSTSSSYTPPPQYSRRDVYRHNSKYEARMRSRKAKSRARRADNPAPGFDPSRA
ncbi:hypothetical protein LMG28614_05650 [Paraburkholderia ultramafica]|uniref:Restriction endonuclease type IV Mrr domain-containing protein n=1 Tax=Paraburkholderia ultramafica TaxID=1544867 RepID=A0A6S7BKZ6_9BURK|nr:restriction endonuclease [Paraburkholderia ultramafica]CAB3802585.1 hypothetical protein LMG28614_05650 [Paraburkholderia ultramafica]